jgi:uncharacterized repeat protein (TIGR03803 family)
VLYTFKNYEDASEPGPLLEFKGGLYGSSDNGGDSDSGTVFAVTTAGKERVVYDFKGGYSALQGGSSRLTALNGALYGTTLSGGGGSNSGTIFSISPKGKLRWVYAFQGGKDGSNPGSNVVALNGALYGVTNSGGAYGDGTVYTVSTSGKERVLYSFKPRYDASKPWGELIAVNGVLYGTAGGGKHNSGAIFSVTTSGKERVIYDFKGGTAGSNPNSLLFLNNILYGTLRYGGAKPNACYQGCGIVFKVSLSGQGEHAVHIFQGPPGDAAYPGPLLAINGSIYGNGWIGGSGRCSSSLSCGAVYAIDSKGNERIIHNFAGGKDGENPSGPLVLVNGYLYGTTFRGGSSFSGTFYRVLP